jgi:hypothetical protein
MKSARAVLPGALIDYLFALALQNPETDVQTFRMEPGVLGGRALTHVEHTIFRSGFRERRRVFGFEPIRAAVSICFDGIGYNMSLADYEFPDSESEAANDFNDHTAFYQAQ